MARGSLRAALATMLGSDTPAGPRNVRKRPRTVGTARLVGAADGGVGTSSLGSVERCHIFAERPFTCGNWRPVVVKAQVVHADHQLRFRNVHETLLDKCVSHFTRLHHRLKAIAAAQLAPAFAERRHRIYHHTHAGHATEVVPHGCRDHAAWSNDTA